MEEPESRQTVRIFGSENRARRGGERFHEERASGAKRCNFPETSHITGFSRPILFFIGTLPFIVF
jgi:hypothetical protein